MNSPLLALGAATIVITVLTAIATIVLFVQVYGSSEGSGFGGGRRGPTGATGAPGSGSGGGGSLEQLSDVTITPPVVDGDALIYSASTMRWVNRYMTFASASYAYGGSNTDVPALYALNMPTRYVWENLFLAIGADPQLITNNILFPAPNFSAVPFSGYVQWLKPLTNLFAHVSVSAGAPVSGNTYQVAIFVDNVIVPGSAGTINFSINNKVASYSFATMITVGLNGRIDMRMRQVTTAIGTFANITNANLSLFATTLT